MTAKKNIKKEDNKNSVKDESSDVNSMDKTEEVDTGDFKWYAVRILSGHENKVKLYLDNEIKTENLQDKIRNVLIPLEKVYEIKDGKKKVKYKNFLSGYILIEAILDDKIKNFIARTPSIINMVGTKSIKSNKLEPIPLRPSEIKRIKNILNEDSGDEKIDFKLKEGDPVKVISGPFNGFSGNVLQVYPEKLKVKVMVSILGRKTPIDFDIIQIEKEK